LIRTFPRIRSFPPVHDQCMDIAYISALSALAGSVVGGLTSGT
jgi:hypothetical protein